MKSAYRYTSQHNARKMALIFKSVLLLVLLTTSLFSHRLQAQNVIAWDEYYKLQLSDFQAHTSTLGGNIYSLHSSARMDFSFHMSNYEFMFTKNFNDKVHCTFTRSAASLIAPDQATADALLWFAQYEFDLSELYARKFRKKLFEEKGAFSSVRFFQPIYDALQQEFVERHAQAAHLSDIGRNAEEMTKLHAEVAYEIKELSDFCKSCKPSRKKKK